MRYTYSETEIITREITVDIDDANPAEDAVIKHARLIAQLGGWKNIVSTKTHRIIQRDDDYIESYKNPITT